MASIHRDPRSPKGVWYCAYTLADGSRSLRSTGKKDKVQAQIVCQALQQAENEAGGGELSRDRLTELFNETLKRLGQSPVERISVKAWLTDWLASKEGKISPSSILAYSQTVREFLEYLGEAGSRRRLESITERDIEGFIAVLRKDGRSPSTINKIVRKYLSAPFEKARAVGKIKYNPVRGTSPEKTTSAPKETFTGEQIAALLSVASPDWQGAILFAYGTGARLGDVAGLKWSNLDVANGIVVFKERKTASKAVIGLHPDFTDWLSARPVPPDNNSPVFPSLSGKALNGENGLSNLFVRLLDRAGIEKRLLRAANTGKGRNVRALTFHSLRHTAASNVFNQASLKEITRRVTNHAAGGVLDAYIHQDLEAIRAAVELIPRLPRRVGDE
jgi:integrase